MTCVALREDIEAKDEEIEELGRVLAIFLTYETMLPEAERHNDGENPFVTAAELLK